MATFIHVFAEAARRSIQRRGIKAGQYAKKRGTGVYASPVTQDYYFTHQWCREIKRQQNVPKLVARFRIPDDEEVYIGRYGVQHIRVAASAAIRIAREHVAPAGLEVIIPRSIKPKEILKIYKPAKALGWRYYPEAKGKKPCGCAYCQKGEPYSAAKKKAA